MTLRLHWSPDSANLVIRAALEEFGLANEGVRVDRAAGEQRGAAYRRLNPQGLIPVLEDGPLVLFETGAILVHLADRTGRLGPDGPAADDPVARAAFLKWLFYLSNTLHADLRIAFRPNRWIAEPGGAALRTGVAARVAGHLDLIEGETGASGFLGAEATLPDIYLAMMLRWMQLYPVEAPVVAGLGRWPGLSALAARIEARPAIRRAMLAEAVPPDRAITAPRPPDLPAAEVTG